MNEPQGVRKLREDMQLLEVASNSDPRDTLVLIKVHDTGNGFATIEIAGSAPDPGITRRELQAILSSAYRHVATMGNGKMSKEREP